MKGNSVYVKRGAEYLDYKEREMQLMRVTGATQVIDACMYPKAQQGYCLK